MDHAFCHMPLEGQSPEWLRQELLKKKARDFPWETGRLFGYVYHAGQAVKQVALDAMALYLSENALNASTFPSAIQLEAQLVAMVAHLLHAPTPCGLCTAGGTESILMAMLAAREKARRERGAPPASWKVVVPRTVHPAFDKAAHLLGLRLAKVDVGADGRACVEKLARALDAQTIMVAASAPCWPWGLIDPIAEIGQLAMEKGLYFHVDACVGGMFLPFVPQRTQLPPWDFRAEGVHSISVDLHKYGYAPKGLSVLLYREKSLRRLQYFTTTDWPGGLFATPALAGTRSAATLAAGWAVMHYLGRQGYERLAAEVMRAAHRLRRHVEAHPHLALVGNPQMSILAITSATLDLFQLADELALRGWAVGRQQAPPSLHLILNPIHVPIVEAFMRDLDAAVEAVRRPPARTRLRQWSATLSARLFRHLPPPLQDRLFRWAQRHAKASPRGRQAALYGMIGSLQAEEQIEKVLSDYLDRMFAVGCAPTGEM